MREMMEGLLRDEQVKGDVLWRAGHNEYLIKLLPKIPQSLWSRQGWPTYEFNEIHEEEEDWTLLHYAACGDNPEAIKTLAKFYQDHGVSRILETKSHNGQGSTPLLLASYNHCLQSMEALIQVGANVHVKNVIGEGLMDNAVLFYRSVACFEKSVPLKEEVHMIDQRFIVTDEFTVTDQRCRQMTRLLFRYGLNLQKDVAAVRQPTIPLEMWHWQQEWSRQISHCRAATLALLSVKRVYSRQQQQYLAMDKSGVSCLARWDRFLLVYLARHVWALGHAYQ